MKKKFNIFQWTCIALIAILVCVIIIQLCIMAANKQHEDDVKNKIEKLPIEDENISKINQNLLKNSNFCVNFNENCEILIK